MVKERNSSMVHTCMRDDSSSYLRILVRGLREAVHGGMVLLQGLRVVVYAHKGTSPLLVWGVHRVFT